MNRLRLQRGLARVAGFACLFLLLALPRAQALETIAGTLADGTVWRAVKPDNYNGTLLLDLDFAGPGGSDADLNPLARWITSQGYAMGGTQREPVAYEFRNAVENLLLVRNAFTAKWGEPRRTLAMGGSRGAFVARLALQFHPEIFKGGLILSGGGAGSIAGLNAKLDGVWTLKTLVDPAAPLQLVNIGDVAAEQAALAALVRKAMASPAGRARFALAAAFEQYPRWSERNKPEPGAHDYDAQLEQIAATFVFGNPASVRAGVEKVGGGNVSWNHGIDYAAQLRRSGSRDIVTALYREARLDLAADLATLAAAPRIAADPAAVARAEKLTSYDGKVGGPVVNVDNPDPVDAASLKLAYLDTLRRAGNAGQLRILWVHGAGHGGQTALERATGFAVLMQRLDDGKWGDTSPASLAATAARIAGQSRVPLGEASFVRLQPAPPLRRWDAANWDSYRKP